MLERPTITACWLLGSTPLRTNSCCTPYGGNLADVYGVKAVYVLRRVDPEQHATFVDLRGQRQLHQHAVDSVVGVETLDDAQQLAFRGFLPQLDRFVVQARLIARLPLHLHVDLRGGVFADEHDGQPRGDAARLERVDLSYELGPHVPADRRAVDELGVTWQRSPPASRAPPRP